MMIMIYDVDYCYVAALVRLTVSVTLSDRVPSVLNLS